jgi:hypothetical protein
MTNKLESQYLEFVRKLAARSLPDGPLGVTAKTAALRELIDIHNEARALHQALLDSGYGK